MATGSTPVSCHRITLQVAPGWGKGYREGRRRGLNRLLHSKRVPEPLPESLPVDFAIDRRRRLLNEDFCDAFRALGGRQLAGRGIDLAGHDSWRDREVRGVWRDHSDSEW